MKAYDIDGVKARESIAVALEPYPHLVLGEGGHKRATWIALGKRDAEMIIVVPKKPCPSRMRGAEQGPCRACGTTVPPPPEGYMYGAHPNEGEVNDTPFIKDVAVIAIKDTEGKPNGKYLIVAPRNGDDNRVLVLWRVSSGYRGGASITAGEGVTVIASDSAWHSGRGSIGETAEMLAILKPGQELRASRSGRRVQNPKAKLVYDGETIKITFGGEEMVDALANEVEGEYL